MASVIRVWRSLVSRLVRDQEAVGSSPATRTKKRQGVRRTLCLFSLYDVETTVSCLSRSNVRDQVTEPSTAGGGRSEAEEEKNKENCEAPQASKATIFFLVAVGSSPATRTKNHRLSSDRLCFFFYKGLEGRAVQSNSPVDCCDRERPSDRSRANQVPPLGPLKLLVYQRSYRLCKEFFLFKDSKVTINLQLLQLR